MSRSVYQLESLIRAAHQGATKSEREALERKDPSRALRSSYYADAFYAVLAAIEGRTGCLGTWSSNPDQINLVLAVQEAKNGAEYAAASAAERKDSPDFVRCQYFKEGFGVVLQAVDGDESALTSWARLDVRKVRVFVEAGYIETIDVPRCIVEDSIRPYVQAKRTVLAHRPFTYLVDKESGKILYQKPNHIDYRVTYSDGTEEIVCLPSMPINDALYEKILSSCDGRGTEKTIVRIDVVGGRMLWRRFTGFAEAPVDVIARNRVEAVEKARRMHPGRRVKLDVL